MPAEKVDPRGFLADSLAGELAGALGAAAGRLEAAVAGRLGLSLTDYRCLGYVSRATEGDPLTAGHLAERTGLTTGAITGVLDRLERAGYVVREKGAEDRRKVLIRPIRARRHEVDALLDPWTLRWREFCEGFTEADLRLVHDFLRSGSEILVAEAARLEHSGPAPDAGEGEWTAPVDGIERATLELAGGTWHVVIRTEPGPHLYRARGLGRTATVRHHPPGTVTLKSTGGAWRVFAGPPEPATLILNPAVQWTLRARGGAARLQGDLSALDLTGIDCSGGATRMDLVLPAPRGTVPLRIDGGVHDVRLTRPAEVPVRIRIRGGASGLTIDGVRLGTVGGELRWESPHFATATDRFDLDLAGGAAGIVIGTPG